MPRIAETADRIMPVSEDTSGVTAVLRLRALMMADECGWLEFIGPVDPDVVDPSRLTYAVLMPGMVVGENVDEWVMLAADEVLPFVYGLACVHGRTDLAVYRTGLPAHRGTPT